MKRILLIICLLMGTLSGAEAQNAMNVFSLSREEESLHSSRDAENEGREETNNNADAIVGTYSGKQGSDSFRARVTKQQDGTYRAQIIWLEHDRDGSGKKILDAKNTDKSLRSTPADRIVIFSGLHYNAKKHRWDDAKIYDPQRGIRAHLVADFAPDGRLRLKGSLFGISETVYWTKE